MKRERRETRKKKKKTELISHVPFPRNMHLIVSRCCCCCCCCALFIFCVCIFQKVQNNSKKTQAANRRVAFTFTKKIIDITFWWFTSTFVYSLSAYSLFFFVLFFRLVWLFRLCVCCLLRLVRRFVSKICVLLFHFVLFLLCSLYGVWCALFSAKKKEEKEIETGKNTYTLSGL